MMIVANEKRLAEECLEKGIPGKKPLATLDIVAKYLHWYQGLNGNQLAKALSDLVFRHRLELSGSKSYWMKKIEELVKNAGKRRLYEIDGVWITESELRTITALEDKVLERLAFTMLCVAKLNMEKCPDNGGWVNLGSNELFKLANIYDKELQRAGRISALYEKGYIRLPDDIGKENYQVVFADDESEKRLFVSDFRDLGFAYRQYKGEKFIRCAKCQRLVMDNANGTKKYCGDCAAYKPINEKVLFCTNCGKNFIVPAKNNRACRCPECQAEWTRQISREAKRRKRMREPIPATVH